MADYWDMSFLIDQATKIHEARGNFGKHLGKPLRGLVGDHLINCIYAVKAAAGVMAAI